MRNFDSGAEFEADLNQIGIELLRPTRRGEALRAGERALALTAAIRHHDEIGAPPRRPCRISGYARGRTHYACFVIVTPMFTS